MQIRTIQIRTKQGITVLSFFYFNKNFITNFFSKLQKNISGYKIFEDIFGFGLLHRF